ncbi:PucR family transcriptional regulator [Bifidobacterium subtile]|uniref:DNA-binding protein n=1 Tax=Bifidobacterium subtile TaxID=77635 RepID=A0A087EAI2_9BIFI|nr:PucR family transcriptional regulator [Bifidobacterium subtile]KFJ04783.1 DNA-binding protein [Bifidobacterium subtile]QOL35857.1 PucR family transcriptional regulator [Bifidobacterium subtile]
MSLTVQELLQIDALHLRPMTDTDVHALEHHIVWVHQSEIMDSRAFSEPGEILLTVGLNLPKERNKDPQGNHSVDTHQYQLLCEEYVRGMYEAGVLACGFGTGIKHDTVPVPLIEAARHNELPLFEVPLEIPFQSIEKEVYRSIVDDEYATIRATYSAQRRLIAAANSEYPIHSVILKTAESVGGWAAFLAANGDVIDSSHIAPRGLARNLGLEFIARCAMEPNPRYRPKTMFFLRDGLDCCICEVFSEQQEIFGFVVAGIPRSDKSDMTLRSVATVAAEILSVSMPQQQSQSGRIDHLRSIVLSHAAHGHADIVIQMARDLWGGIPAEPVEVHHIPDIGQNEPSIRSLCSMLSSRVDTIRGTSSQGYAPHGVIFGYYDSGFWMLCNPSDRSVVQEAVIATTKDLNRTIGRSTPRPWTELDRAFDEARVSSRLGEFANATTLGTVRRNVDSGSEASGRLPTVMEMERIATLNQLDLVEPCIADAYADALLQPLTDAGSKSRHTRQVLLDTLEMLVECSFNLARCATRIGVHHHTVENRVVKIQQLLGVNLTDMDDMTRVWFAVNALKRRNARAVETFEHENGASGSYL